MQMSPILATKTALPGHRPFAHGSRPCPVELGEGRKLILAMPHILTVGKQRPLS